MVLFLQPLFQEDDHEHGGHDEIQPLCIKMDKRTEYSAEGGSEKPVKMVEQGDKKHEPALIDIFRDMGLSLIHI